MSEITYQTMKRLLWDAPNFEESDSQTVASMLADVRYRWWSSEFLGLVAERVLEHLRVGRRFGIATLKADVGVPGDWIKLEKAEPIESLSVGFSSVIRAGQQRDFRESTAQALKMLEQSSPQATSAFLVEKLSENFAGGAGYRHVKDVRSVIQRREELLERPGNVVYLNARLNDFLQFGGLPMTESEGETIIVCARSGHGKTALALETVLKIANAGHRVHYNVLADATEFQIRERLVYAVAGIAKHEKRALDSNLIASGTRVKETVRERLTWAETVVNDLEIFINTEPHFDQHTLKVRLRHTQVKGAVFSVWDNLDHMDWDSQEEGLDRRNQLGRLTRMIREFDRDTGHHSMILAQANRETERNLDKIPTQHNTQDSDQPKNHCTIFIGLHNPNVDSDQFGGDHGLKARISKNRDGLTGVFDIPISLLNPKSGEVFA